MEINNLFYIMVIVLGGLLTIFGIKTKIGLLNILAIPLWVFMAVEWASMPLLMIVMIGLALFEVIYLFKTYGEMN